MSTYGTPGAAMTLGLNQKKRCPNIAWAFWHARKLNLDSRERLVLLALAERADRDLYCAPTQALLALDTGQSERTVNGAVKSLLSRGDCIETERRREGLRYRLLRPADACQKCDHPIPETWETEVEAAPELVPQNPPVPTGIVPQQEPPILPVMTAETTEIAEPAPQELPNPLMKRIPLKESPEERTSLRSVTRVRATPQQPAEGVVNLPTKAGEAVQVFEAWNAVAERCDLPKVVRPGEAVRQKLAVLIRRRGVDDVLTAIEAVGASSWCNGGNDRGWRADFYFLLQTKSFDRLLSGFYADRPGKARYRPGSLAAFAQDHGIGAMQPTFDLEPEPVGGPWP